MTDAVAAILKMPLFKGFTEDGVRSLIRQGQVQEHAAGAQFCKEGDVADGVILILSGKLRVYVERGGKEYRISDFSTGTVLGDIAVLCGIPRSASVRALEPSTVLFWPDKAYRMMLLGDSYLSQRIMTNTLRMLIEREKSAVDAAARGEVAAAST